MARAALRSPYFISVAPTVSTTNSVVLTISINSVIVYTLTKNTVYPTVVEFEIAELVRDYLNITWDITRGINNAQVINFTWTMQFYNEANGAGNLIQTETSSIITGFEAYGYFMEGVNPEPPFYLSETACFLIAPKLGTTDQFEIFVPEGATGHVPIMTSGVPSYEPYDSTDTSISNGSASCTINRISCSKYGDGTFVSFINKYGMFQDLWFSLKRVLTTNTTKEQYQGINLYTSGTMGYSVTTPTKVVYDKEATERISLSSGYYPEGHNAVFEQLLESEQVWMRVIDQAGTIQYMPVNVVTSSFVKKTKLNDKLIDYTIEFAQAFDKINNIR